MSNRLQEMPKEKLDICVVIPTFNRAILLEKTLQALENQDCGGIQIAICNDASTDGTETVINDWKGSSRHHILSVENTVNSGPAFSFRAALQLSSAKFIVALGDDDILLPNHISNLYKIIFADSSTLAVFVHNHGLRAKLTHIWNLIVLGGDCSEGMVGVSHLFAGNSINGPGTMFRRSGFEENFMHPTNILAQDFELWLYLVFNGRTVHSNQRIAYGRTPGSLSRSPGVAQELDLGLSIRRFLMSTSFTTYLQGLKYEERKLVRDVLEHQLYLLGTNNSLAYALATSGTFLQHKRGRENLLDPNRIKKVVKLHDDSGGWTLEKRQASIGILEGDRAPSIPLMNSPIFRLAPKFIKFAKFTIRAIRNMGKPRKLRSLEVPRLTGL